MGSLRVYAATYYSVSGTFDITRTHKMRAIILKALWNEFCFYLEIAYQQTYVLQYRLLHNDLPEIQILIYGSFDFPQSRKAICGLIPRSRLKYSQHHSFFFPISCTMNPITLFHFAHDTTSLNDLRIH